MQTIGCCSFAQWCLILHNLMDCRSPVLHHFPEFAQNHVIWVGDTIQPSHPLSSPSLPAFSLFTINVFSRELARHIRRPKYWSFSFNISPSNEYSESISFRIDWFDLLAVQGALMCLIQNHSSKASVLQCSAFFMVQLWHPYMTTGKTITLSMATFVTKVMSLLFDTLSRWYSFFPMNKCLLISWLQSQSSVILEPKKIKFIMVLIISPSISHEVMGSNTMILVF